MKHVPRVVLNGKHLPATYPMTWRCTDCDAPFAATSEAALTAAFDAHIDYVNATADRASDPHFELLRLGHLLADV